MEKIRIDAHPSVLIVQSDETGELITAKYDLGYPRIPYRGATNLIGGNPNIRDISPISVLEREITEEIAKGTKTHDFTGKKIDWADERDSTTLREAILDGVSPYKDFLFRAEKMEGDKLTPHTALFSAFYSRIPRDVLEIARRNIEEGRQLLTEGFLGICTLEELETGQLTEEQRKAGGKYTTAHGTPFILNSYFNVRIPHPKENSATELETPIRNTLKEYRKEFEYGENWASH